MLARAERLLRLTSLRLALGAPGCIDFTGLLNGKIVLASMEPPQGSVDLARFLSGVLWVKLTQAIRRRPNGSPPAMVVLEEAPAFLAAGTSRTADALEDVLRLARAKGVFLGLLSQDLGSLSKIAPSLPTVIKTNVQLHAVFRAAPGDDWSFVLPVTGLRQRGRSAPWEERRHGYLDRGAELALLKEEHCRLPDRHAYLTDRRSGLPGVLMRTADLNLDATDGEVRELEAHAASSDAVVSVAEVEAEERALAERLGALLGRTSTRRSGSESPLPRRGRSPVEMG